MKKLFTLITVIVFVLSIAGCAPAETAAVSASPAPTEAPATPTPEPTELIVFAAASMTETLTEIGAMYEAEHPEVKLVFTFDSSGTLKTQIEEGADCDVYIAASQKPMNQLDITADAAVNTDGLDFVLTGTRRDILENKVTLCVPEGNPAGIASFSDWAEKLKTDDVFFAMGNSDVPVGQYTQKILSFYGLDETALADAGCITYGSNVKEVVTQVAENTVDCGVVYCTDAYSANLTIVDYATSEMCGQVIYPAAVMNISQNPDAAKAFLEFLETPEATAVFEAVGFTAVD